MFIIILRTLGNPPYLHVCVVKTVNKGVTVTVHGTQTHGTGGSLLVERRLELGSNAIAGMLSGPAVRVLDYWSLVVPPTNKCESAISATEFAKDCVGIS